MQNPNLEQLASAQKANTEVMTALMRTAFDGMEKMAALNLAAAREYFNTSVTNAQQIMAAKDAQDLGRIQTTFAQPNVEKMMEYSRNVYDLVTQMQRQVTEVMESQYGQMTKAAKTTIEKTTAQAPVGGDVFAAAMNSMLGATNKAFENMQSMARQMADIADANVKAGASATAQAVNSASKKK